MPRAPSVEAACRLARSDRSLRSSRTNGISSVGRGGRMRERPVVRRRERRVPVGLVEAEEERAPDAVRALDPEQLVAVAASSRRCPRPDACGRRRAACSAGSSDRARRAYRSRRSFARSIASTSLSVWTLGRAGARDRRTPPPARIRPTRSRSSTTIAARREHRGGRPRPELGRLDAAGRDPRRGERELRTPAARPAGSAVRSA